MIDSRALLMIELGDNLILLLHRPITTAQTLTQKMSPGRDGSARTWNILPSLFVHGRKWRHVILHYVYHWFSLKKLI